MTHNKIFFTCSSALSTSSRMINLKFACEAFDMSESPLHQPSHFYTHLITHPTYVPVIIARSSLPCVRWIDLRLSCPSHAALRVRPSLSIHSRPRCSVCSECAFGASLRACRLPLFYRLSSLCWLVLSVVWGSLLWRCFGLISPSLVVMCAGSPLGVSPPPA